MKIGEKLLLFNAITLILILTLGVSSLVVLHMIDSRYSECYTASTKSIQDTAALRGELFNLENYTSNLVVLASPSYPYKRAAGLIEDQKNSVETSFDTVRETLTTDAQETRLERIRHEYRSEVLPLLEIVLSAIAKGDANSAMADMARFRIVLESTFSQLKDLMSEIVVEGENISGELSAVTRLLHTVNIAILAVITLIFLGASFIMSRSITKPIYELKAAALEIVKGNLSTKISYQSNDELGGLAEASRQSAISLASYIEEIERSLVALGNGNLDYRASDIFQGDFIAIKNAIDRIASVLLQQYTRDQESRLELERAYNAANRANKAKSDFLSSMSHDIRTPMNAVVGLTAIAQSNLDNPDKVKSCLRKIAQSSAHLLGLINDVLDMSKIESGNMTLNNTNISLPEVLDNIVNIAHPQIKARKQQFSIRLHNVEHEKLVCDSLRLNQLLINILSNAIKFTPVRKSVTIDVRELASEKEGYAHYHFVFTDTGIGMSQEFIRHIFSAFSRDDTAQVKKIEGTGLGMAICKKISELMGGNIHIESEIGKGSVFTVDLHLKISEVETEDMHLPGLRILVVDDDAVVSETCAKTLLEMGAHVQGVDNGKAAVTEIIKAHNEGNAFEAAILDWQMPGLNGIETAQAIRNTAVGDIPIIIMSAYDWAEIADEARQAGVNGFVTKPLFKSTLYYAVQRYVYGRCEGQDGYLSALDGSFDFTGKTILLVEDNEINQMVALEVLSPTGADIEQAWNGSEAVALFEQSAEAHYDIILMDVQMPLMDGYTATKRIRQLHRQDAARVPIVAMTANAFSEDMEAALSSGMNGHIPKPVDPNKLLREIDTFFRQTERTRQEERDKQRNEQ